MTDRYNGLFIVLDHDIRDDDAKALISAIKQLRGVLGVEPHVADPMDSIATMRVRTDLMQKLWDVFKDQS